MPKDGFVDWDDFAKFKSFISFLKGVECYASKSCSFWGEGDFCLFPGRVKVGTMGTCLSMEVPENFGKPESDLP